MNKFISTGLAGLLITLTAGQSHGQGSVLSALTPTLEPGHLVQYRFTCTDISDDPAHRVPEFSGLVEMVNDSDALYYKEFRDGRPYTELLYNRKAHRVLLFNLPRHRLNILSALPFNAARFIPFPFQSDDLLSFVRLNAARSASLTAGTRQVSVATEVGVQGNTVPARIQATVVNSPSGPKVDTFSIRAPDGEVSRWAYTFASGSGRSVLPANITQRTAESIVSDDQKILVMQHHPVPPVHWRPDSQITYTFIEDRLLGAGELPTEATILQSVDERTTVVDRRDVKNPISFSYRKDGGDLETQARAAPLRKASVEKPDLFASLWHTGGYFLLAPFVLCAGWGIRRRMVRPAQAQASRVPAAR